MKHLLLTTFTAALLAGCGEPGDKLSPRPQAESIKKTIPTDFNTAKTTLENQLIHHLKSGDQCIAVAQFGIYESVAVLKLNPQPIDSDIQHITIKGSYYYIKHGKKIELDGYLNTDFSRVVLKESYEGKITGHIQFSGDDSAENYWQLSESTEKDKANLIYIHSMDSVIGAGKIFRMYFENIFNVRDYSQPENSPLYEAKDSVWACKLPDNSLAFHINVTGDNFHLGGWNGIALPSKSSNVLIHKSFSNGSKCELKIELSIEKKITFKDVDCEDCCGLRPGAAAAGQPLRSKTGLAPCRAGLGRFYEWIDECKTA